MDSREHTVKDFLQRPIPLVNQDWLVANTQFETLYTTEFPDSILTNTMYTDKLTGFLGIRADIHIRLQVNAQPFQAGRLILAWVPYYRYLGNRVANFDLDNAGSMASLTGCPHIQLDISQHTEADLIIPYASNQSFFNLATGEGYYGKLYLKVYSPLTDPTGSGTVDFTLWFNFQDVTLAFPTGSALTTTSLSPSQTTAQVGQEEKQAETNRTFANAVSKFASALRTVPPVPALDSILQPAAWASDALSDILRYFGLSKIESTNIPNYIKQSPCRFMPNYNGVNMSHSLALSSDNAIEGMADMAPEQLDEMAINHIIKTPTYLTNFSWSTALAAGSQLYVQPINPLQFTVPGILGSNTFTPSMLTFVSSAFVYWRGSIKFTFKFVKTKFHSGRVRIFFQPGLEAFGVSNANYNYSQIVDLRSETEVCFVVPYINTKPWRMLESGTSVIAIGNINFTGVLYMEVLNELKANTSVATSINIIVEVAGGEDFELAAPCSPVIQPVLLLPAASSSVLKRLRAIAQVGEEANREESQGGTLNSDQLGQALLHAPWALNLAMQGEKVLSIRQLIKRSSGTPSFSSLPPMLKPRTVKAARSSGSIPSIFFPFNFTSSILS